MNKLSMLILLVLFMSGNTFSDSSSPSTSPFVKNISKGKIVTRELQAREVENTETNITFSEFPVDTSITDQYADKGIIFGGDNPFISPDGANPTSPVLSGSPRFEGAMTGIFVDPEDQTKPITVGSFQLDAGYFDAIGSVRLQWFDLNGNKLGQQANSANGIEVLGPTSGSIASWRIETVADEPSGFAIDNVKFIPTRNSSIVFREVSNAVIEFWPLNDEIPGFDHVGFNFQEKVYESYPNGGYKGTYVSKDGTESVTVTADINGPQQVHTLKTFKHDSHTKDSTNVVETQEITIPDDLAQQMKIQIDNKISAGGAGFQYLSFSTIEEIETTMSPAAQKGKDNNFTCVGLVEWAAETSNYNGGEGFIQNSLESFNAPIPIYENEDDIIPTIVWREIPLFSPQLMYEVMKFGKSYDGVKNWFKAFIDPVDFIITDPLGRRIGYSEETGEVKEIPGAIYTGNGRIEMVVIPNPVPGKYSIEYIGKGEVAKVALSANDKAFGYSELLAVDKKVNHDLVVKINTFSPGDLNGDGQIDAIDLNLLIGKLNTFVINTFDPADLDGNGLIDTNDQAILENMINNPIVMSIADINSDGNVDIEDFKLIAASSGSCTGETGFLESADIDSNGCVDFFDYQQWKSM